MKYNLIKSLYSHHVYLWNEHQMMNFTISNVSKLEKYSMLLNNIL